MFLRLALVAVLLCLGSELPAGAHGIYSGLTDAAGASCCNEHDCRPAPYRMTSTGDKCTLIRAWARKASLMRCHVPLCRHRRK
jgi:hypothetical protein